MTIKNPVANGNDDLRAEYDLSKLKGRVRGKYYERAKAGDSSSRTLPDTEVISRGELTSDGKPNAFVLMPFSEGFDELYSLFVMEALSDGISR